MSVEDLLRRGAGCEAAGDLEGAEAAYREADELGDAEGAILLGLVLKHCGNVQGAADAFRRSEARGHPEVGSSLGNLLSDNGDMEGAAAAYERAIAAGSADARLNLGLMLAQQGAVEEALAHLRVAQDGGDVTASWAIGRLLERREDFPGAATAYRNGADGGDANAAFALGAVLMKLHDLDGARAAFQRAHELGHQGAGQFLEFLANQAASRPSAETGTSWARLYSAACGEVLTVVNACLEVANDALGAWDMAAQRPQHEVSIQTFTRFAEEAERKFAPLYRAFDDACAAARDSAARLLASQSDPRRAEMILAATVDARAFGNVATVKSLLSASYAPSPSAFVQGIQQASELMQRHDPREGAIYRPAAPTRSAEPSCPPSSSPGAGPQGAGIVMPPVAAPETLDARALAGPAGSPGEAASVRRTSAAAAAWVMNTARQAQQHVNPALLQHGVEAVQDALTESRLAKVDKKTGKLKVRKLGVAKAAIRPGQTVRKAIDGAAVGDRLKTYNETVRALPASSSPEEFASYPSKRDFLRDWARRLVVAAQVVPTGHLIDSYANAAAHGICSHVFIPLGAARGISDVSQYFHPDPVPAGPAQQTFDALYLKVAPSPAQRQDADQQITAFLNSIRDQWVKNIRQQHG